MAEPSMYWRGHDRKEDEALVKRLFCGSAIIAKSGPKAGRSQHRYYAADGAQERRAFAALRRVLSWAANAPNPWPVRAINSVDPVILALLVCSLDPDNDVTDRRLVFQFRRRGKPTDSSADLQVAIRVAGCVRAGQKKEAAIAEAMESYGLSRKAVFDVLRRVGRSMPGLLDG